MTRILKSRYFNFSLIFVSLFLFQSSSSGEQSTKKENMVISNRGGFFSRLWNRGTLSNYAFKIGDYSIKYEELQDYIKKGGNVDQFEHYSIIAEAFSDSGRPLLNYFLDKLNENIESREKDRLKCIELLLENGSNPNQWFDTKGLYTSDFPPILYSIKVEDYEAFRLLLKKGGNINLFIEDPLRIPAIIAVKDDNIADFIFKNGADLSLKMKFEGHEYNLLMILLKSYESNEHMLNRVRWMQKNKINFDWEENSTNDPIKLVQENIKFIERNPNIENTEMVSPKTLKNWQEILAVLPTLKRN